MKTLNSACKEIIQNFNAGAVATVNDDGTPAVSIKATFVIVDNNTIAFGDIRSPGTIANIRNRPQVEVNFIDVLTRRAVRIRGQAEVIPRQAADATLGDLFMESWAPYYELMHNIVVIDINKAELITSPGYDIGLTMDELRESNMDKLKRIYNSSTKSD